MVPCANFTTLHRTPRLWSGGENADGRRPLADERCGTRTDGSVRIVGVLVRVGYLLRKLAIESPSPRAARRGRGITSDYTAEGFSKSWTRIWRARSRARFRSHQRNLDRHGLTEVIGPNRQFETLTGMPRRLRVAHSMKLDDDEITDVAIDQALRTFERQQIGGDEEWRDDPQLIPATICHLTWSLYP